MKKKLIFLCFLLVSVIVFSACTIKFEAEKLKLDADPIEGKIGTIENTNTTYRLTAIDVLKNDPVAKTSTQ